MELEYLEPSFIPSWHKPPSLLPVNRLRRELLHVVETYPVTIIIGQTGSGKTTQLPQMLNEAGWCDDGKVVAVTQPRRIAATSVASRVAEEMRCKLGEEVGYSIRFEDVTSAVTKIKFMTDGLLLREALVDPLLSRYSVIMVDEAHERSISTDILLGILKKIRKRRPELRIVISSATIQAHEFLRYFAGSGYDQDNQENPGGAIARIVSVEGRTYPVDCLFLESPPEDYLERTIRTVLDIHRHEPKGDILVFLTGREEITEVVERLTDSVASIGAEEHALFALPLYAGLTAEQQMYVFEPAPENTRKVVVSTNIAEASVTIDGVVYVIDCGFVKLRAYNPSTGVETLTKVPISKASAVQRAGRAGRTQPGKCFRLYTEQAYQNMPDVTPPEVQRSDMAPVILQLKALGIDDIVRFDFLTAPPAELMIRGFELLYSLGAIDDYAKLSRPLGLHMAELAVDPKMAKVLLSAASFGCLDEMLSIAAMTGAESGSVWVNHDDGKEHKELTRRKFAAEEGDHLTYLNVFKAFVTKGRKEMQWCRANGLDYKFMTRAVSVKAQLGRYLERFGVRVDKSAASQKTTTAEAIQRCLTCGYFAHAGRMQPDGTFLPVNGGITLHAHPSSLMFVSLSPCSLHSSLNTNMLPSITESKSRLDYLQRDCSDFWENFHTRYHED